MRKLEGNLVFSPSDLITFMESEYASWMDRFYMEFPDAVQPDQDSAEDRILQARGEEHERTFLQELTGAGRDVCDLKGKTNSNTVFDAMKAGRETIYQAPLASGCFAGFADFLMRVEGQSALGNYHYEAWDTKLARKPKPYFIIQLCCYSEMLAELQHRLPEEFQVVLGTRERRRFRTEDYFYYYRQLKLAFLEQQERFDPKAPPEIPGPNNLGRWSEHATKILEARDDLTLIAGIRSTQVQKLRNTGIRTTRALVETPRDGVPGITPPAFDRLRNQARLQIASSGQPQPRYEILKPDPLNPRLGLAILPPASPSDIFFDIEGFPFFEDGLEYLLGVTYFDNGNLNFRDWWAHSHEQEKAAFQGFVSWAHSRWRRDPSLHIYHYAAYEVTALRRLMGRYAICEEEVDQLLRAEAFVDLYSVVRQGVLVGEPAYSLKNIEKLYQVSRISDVTTSGDSLGFYQKWLESNDGDDWKTSPTLRAIREYNREDCESTWKLACWLRDLQKQAKNPYIPKEAAPESDTVKQITAQALYAQEMRTEILADRSANLERWRVHELLSWFLEFH
jgi:predicted RecB family nuclease